MVNIIKKINHNEIMIFLENFNLLKFTSELNNFLSKSKNILYGPNLLKKIFRLDLNICKSVGFENINLGRYWTDELIYQINKLDNRSLTKSLQKIKIPYISEIFNTDGTECSNIIITPNEYPYQIPNTNYKYYLLWDLSNSNLSISSVETIFKSKLLDKDYLIWKNPLIYKSIRTIEHFHIMIRPRQSSLKLKRLYVISRHGPREPIFNVKNFISGYWDRTKNINYKEAVYAANLTDLGKLYCNFIGKLLGLNYSDDFDFNSLNNLNTLIASTNFDRTIQSAILTLDGIGLTSVYDNIKIVNFIGSDTILTLQERKSYDEKMKNPQINWDVDLTSLNNEIKELTGIDVKNFRDYFDLACTMRCYEFNNYKMLSDDNLNSRLLEIKPTIYNLSTYYYNIVHNPKDIFYSESKKIGETAIENVLELFNNSSYDFAYFSTHDNIIMPIVKNLVNLILNSKINFEGLDLSKDFFTQNVRSKINYMEFPDFNSMVRFELWESSDNNKIIRIYYNSLMLFEFS